MEDLAPMLARMRHGSWLQEGSFVIPSRFLCDNVEDVIENMIRLTCHGNLGRMVLVSGVERFCDRIP